MPLSYLLESEKKNVRVYHVTGTLEDGEIVQSYVISTRKPTGVVIYNANNKTIEIETAPTKDGPWVTIEILGKYSNSKLEDYSIYTRLKLKEGDSVDFWATIYKL